MNRSRKFGVVAIGRNEGSRLVTCLESAVRTGGRVIYVDSGSTDGSLDAAAALGADAVPLDLSIPFSAGRARNVGAARLREIVPDAEFVQFVDGDCELIDGWTDRALHELADASKVAAVCGRRRERYPSATVYNRLQDLEWNTPIGEARSCGGDAMIRLTAFDEVGGFDASVVAGEEPEMCQRMRARGWTIRRIDAEMTLHDAAIHRLGQWWKRQVRSGYGGLDVLTRFAQGPDPLFGRQIRSARVWTILTPLMPLQAFRLATQRAGELGWKDSIRYGGLTMMGKWANVVGQAQYLRDRRAGRNTRMIDYKSAGPASSAAPGPMAASPTADVPVTSRETASPPTKAAPPTSPRAAAS